MKSICLNKECGKEFRTFAHQIKIGKGKYCSRECWNRAGHKIIYKDRRIPALNSLFYVYKKNAEYRNLGFIINIKDFENITSLPCFYCGKEPIQIKKYRSSSYIYNGVDRIDNTIGYSIDNCVPACGRCNWMKSDMSTVDFINHIKNISNIHGGK